jgi:hypothetical protein
MEKFGIVMKKAALLVVVLTPRLSRLDIHST